MSRFGEHRLGSAWIVCVCSIAVCVVGCVDTDTPQDQDSGFVPFMPDQAGQDAGSLDMSPDADGPDEDLGDGGTSSDMSIEPPVDASPDMMQPVFCMPNNDGVITRQEVPLRAGLSATYSVTGDVAFDTAGEEQGDGTRVWDLSGELPGDSRVIVEAASPTGRWFSTDFPQATYVTPLSSSSTLLGIFEIAPESLNLLGVASPDDGFTATNVDYDPVVRVLDFPLEMGKSWADESSVSGTVNGVFSFYSEDYSSQVDARGIMKTPYGDLEVLRIRVELERTVGLLTTTVRTYLFVSECFGTVATVVSEDDEDAIEFTQAAEVRRLSR